MATITGDKQLDRKLRDLGEKAAKKAIRAGVSAGLTPIAKAMRAAINASGATPELKRQARKMVGKRLKKAKGGPSRGQTEAKVGFAVGKKEPKNKKDRGDRPGFGVSASNIHWFVLGTQERHQKSGHPTGAVPAIFDGVTEQAFAASEAASLAAARAAISQVIEREARRK